MRERITSTPPPAAFAHCPCETRFDPLTRQLYATDASLYQIEPAGVAFPRTAAEAAAAIQAAAEAGLAVTPRGAGSGLTGGALGEGLILDLARHNRVIHHFDPERRVVRVGAGVVLDQLNDFLRPHGFCFGPDVATSSRATLGGMIANDSSGARAGRYGATAEHVAALELVLADGTVVWSDRPAALAPQRALAAQLVRDLAPVIRERTPPGLRKRWPGYALSRLLEYPGNPNFLLTGSEGTLAAIFSAELVVSPLPPRKGLGVVFFETMGEAMQATVELLELGPAAIEHVDRVLFDQTRGQVQFQAARDLLGLEAFSGESFLIVEFYEEASDRLEALRRKRLGQRTLTLLAARDMALVWELRKAGLSLLTGCPGPAKPVTCIEDCAVPPQRLPAYVADLRALLDRCGVRACFYGHAATGLLHVRPVLDLHDPGGVRRLRQITAEVSALVRQYRGSFAAEHGVGIARTEFLPEHLGTELLEAMRQIKQSFDPRNRFNPGKIIPALEGAPPAPDYRVDTRLRLGAPAPALPFAPRLAYAAKDHAFLAHLEQCNGCGGCLKAAPTMCPTFQATGEELLSTRGRANTIRAALTGRLPEGLQAPGLEEALGTCLACRACATECPSNVSLALLKADLQHARHQAQGLPLAARLIARADLLGRAGCVAPRLANAILSTGPVRALLDATLGLARQRPLPRYATERFDRWFARHDGFSSSTGPTVALWDDTWVRYHEPHVGQAAVAVLHAMGFRVRLLEGRQCCGRPAFSQGDLDRAAALGRHNLALMQALPDGVPILFLEPSCWTMVAQDYVELGLPGAAEQAGRCRLFEEFVETTLAARPATLRLNPLGRPVAIHVHCHVKAGLNPALLLSLARRATTAQAQLLDTGCCGMAGAFGAMRAHYELSLKVGEPLAARIRDLPSHTAVLASGTSCRQQARHLAGRAALHPAEWLAMAL